MSVWDSFWNLPVPMWVALGLGFVTGMVTYVFARMVEEVLTR